MSDETSLVSVSIAPELDPQARNTIILALSAEQQRIMRALASVLDDLDEDSEYGETAYNLLKQLIPEMTDSVWMAVTGSAVPGSECTEYPQQCCGYCGECGSHHEGSNEHSKCSFDYCHQCEHMCDSDD